MAINNDVKNLVAYFVHVGCSKNTQANMFKPKMCCIQLQFIILNIYIYIRFNNPFLLEFKPRTTFLKHLNTIVNLCGIDEGKQKGMQMLFVYGYSCSWH